MPSGPKKRRASKRKKGPNGRFIDPATGEGTIVFSLICRKLEVLRGINDILRLLCWIL